MPPRFNNRPNERVILNDGREVWLSRSCAVVAEVCMYDKTRQQWFILLGKRGIGVPDCQGMWGLPCGYLDWDETISEAVIREVWEECGLYLPALSEHPNFGHSISSLLKNETLAQAAPWAVTDHVGNPKQNISMHFAILFSWVGETLPALSNANCEPNEVDALAWVEINEAKNRSLAFNHQQRVHLFHEAFQTHMHALTQQV